MNSNVGRLIFFFLFERHGTYPRTSPLSLAARGAGGVRCLGFGYAASRSSPFHAVLGPSRPDSGFHHDFPARAAFSFGVRVASFTAPRFVDAVREPAAAGHVLASQAGRAGGLSRCCAHGSGESSSAQPYVQAAALRAPFNTTLDIAIGVIMTIKFEWDGEAPTRPPAEQVTDAFEYDLTNLPDTRGLCQLVVSVHLRQDPLKLKVEGVGYSEDGKRLVTFYYSLNPPLFHWWDYYENPARPKP